MIQLQNMCMDENRIDTKQLYIKGEGRKSGESYVFNQNELLSFDTFYNCFSAGKWKKYTTIETISLSVEISGCFEICIYHADYLEHGVDRRILWQGQAAGEQNREIHITELSLPGQGVLYLQFRCLSENGQLFEWKFMSGGMEKAAHVKMALNICTFHREKEVEHNLSLLKEVCIENQKYVLFQNLEIYLVDNGQSLDIYKEYPWIHYIPNRNIGGTGGFTRGLTEILKNSHEEEISHLIFMDDDVELVPEMLERLQLFLSFLKPEFFQHTVCGSLMRRELPYIQAEAGARWEQGRIISNHANYDMRILENVIKNEWEEEAFHYSGWWFSCVPIAQIKANGLPLPLFLHRDDVEYGLRLKKAFITLNGIGIRHETYDTKLSQATEYYDIRNLAIVESIHNPEFTKERYKKMVIKWMLGNIFRYRYQYITLNIKGVYDFLQGAQWLIQQDAEALHRQLGEFCYGTQTEQRLNTSAYYESISRNGSISTTEKLKLGLSLFLRNNQKEGIMAPWQSVYDYKKYSKVKVVEFSGKSATMEKSRRKLSSSLKDIRLSLKPPESVIRKIIKR